MAGPEVSHGRGGAGNINPDDTKYVDGEVVRAGSEGSHGDGAFSTGRGGAANIGDAGVTPHRRADKDIIPDAAIRHSQETENYHTGRGGAGNERHVSPAGTGNGSSHKAAVVDRGTGGGIPGVSGDHHHHHHHHHGTHERQHSLADKLKWKIFGKPKGHETEVSHVGDGPGH
ncbi:uncharacterized protein B0T23DRAFT_422225 [Neurospora hispaniola]|uniref:Uncharacterized protein n=1 Tax=Neurospora hispaniola TaxID=588809 RepID=A0AAJ0I4C8_9PEZI|nr:hypothetical protein B0T23DRAFT_422225 [Neurospora hispaniola]